MYRRIFGFHRRVWCPKWTPDSSNCFMVTTAMPPPFGSGRASSRPAPPLELLTPAVKPGHPRVRQACGMTTEWCFLPFYVARGTGGLSLRRLRKPPPGTPSVRTGLVGPGESPPETDPPLPVPSSGSESAPFSSLRAYLARRDGVLCVGTRDYYCSSHKDEGWEG